MSNFDYIKQELEQRGRLGFDLETTGLSVKPDGAGGPVTINMIRPLSAAFVLDDGNSLTTVLDEMASLPDHIVAGGAFTANNINPKHLAGRQNQLSLAQTIEQVLQNDVPILHSFNGLSYDAPILRHLFFENLIEPNLLSFGNWVHVDLMLVAYAIKGFATDAINFHVNEKGKLSLKQEDLAEANHIDIGTAHTALDDAITLLKLADLFEDRAPEIYYTAIACGSKRRVLHRIQNEAFFCYANRWNAKALGFITQSRVRGMTNDLFFFNLDYNPQNYLNTSATKLAQLLGRRNTPFVRLGANHYPILLSGPEFCEKIDISSAEATMRSEMIKTHPRFLAEFNQALAIRGNPFKNDEFSTFPEMEIYSGGFPSDIDKMLAKEFQKASYQHKLQIITHLKDTRLKKFAQRLLVLEHPEQCSRSLQRKYRHFSQLRLLRENTAVPNLTIQGAVDQVDELISKGYEDEAMINAINDYIERRKTRLEQ